MKSQLEQQMRKLKFRKVVVMMLVLIICLVACSNEGSTQQTTESAEEKVNLKFIWWGNDTRKQLTEEVIALYETSNPHINIEVEIVSSTDEMAKKLAIYTAQQNMPDIIQADYSFIYNYITRDLIEPLTQYIDSGALNIADIDASYLDGGYWNEQLYGLPMGVNSQTFGYNEEIFKLAGVEVPQNDYNLDQFYEMLVALKHGIKNEDFYPLGNMIDINYYLRASGASFYNQEGNGLGYDDDKIMESYMELAHQWTEEGLLHASIENVKVNEEHPLVTRKSALYSLSTNSITSLSKLTKDSIKLLPHPIIKQGEQGNFIKPSMFLAISSYSEHKEEAAKFMDFFTNDVAANEILNGDRGVPISSKIADHLSQRLDAAGKVQYEFMDYLKSNSRELDPPNPSNHVVINNSYELIRDNVIAGKITASQGAKQFREEAAQYFTN